MTCKGIVCGCSSNRHKKTTSAERRSRLWLRQTWTSLNPGPCLPALSGGAHIRTDPRFHHSDGVRAQLWLRQDGELRDVTGDGGGGRRRVQAAPPELHQQVCCVCLILVLVFGLYDFLNSSQEEAYKCLQAFKFYFPALSGFFPHIFVILGLISSTGVTENKPEDELFRTSCQPLNPRLHIWNFMHLR